MELSVGKVFLFLVLWTSVVELVNAVENICEGREYSKYVVHRTSYSIVIAWLSLLYVSGSLYLEITVGFCALIVVISGALLAYAQIGICAVKAGWPKREVPIAEAEESEVEAGADPEEQVK